jgi:hypothetical protein
LIPAFWDRYCFAALAMTMQIPVIARSPRVRLRRPEDRLCDKAISPNRGSSVSFAALAGCGKTDFASLAHPSRGFAPQDEVFHFILRVRSFKSKACLTLRRLQSGRLEG